MCLNKKFSFKKSVNSQIIPPSYQFRIKYLIQSNSNLNFNIFLNITLPLWGTIFRGEVILTSGFWTTIVHSTDFSVLRFLSFRGVSI